MKFTSKVSYKTFSDFSGLFYVLLVIFDICIKQSNSSLVFLIYLAKSKHY